MPLLNVRCQKCGGSVFIDDEDGAIKCWACRRTLDNDGNQVPPVEPPQGHPYNVRFKIPRSLRRAR